MSLLDSHLGQIALSSNAIAELPFPPPRIFTNALLGPHDITSLIRDTESHERALFQSDPSVKSASSAQRRATRRGTQFAPESEGESMASRIYSARDNKNQSAVARVLGPDMMEEIKRSAGTSSRGRGEVNVEVLLQGAEILCNVYPVAGAHDKIASLRYRHELITDSINGLEARVAKNTAELEKMSRSYGDDLDDFTGMDAMQTEVPEVTDADLEREMEEIRELERRKRALETRVTGMEQDLGGLMG
ncbi:DASH complex, subunit Spc34 [Aspergillus ellipticus CBS 707.79]|uniref:DASH complex subunit SPC34 n=1 Tax=Aspergillus ellipticus CBS 707.79 TaxID=1448320 RepID=A0A319DD07_9EURO|nr:DASH complex, subunit Spc34 [Aspergillus ellipticus CBS 707.79]